MRNIGIAIIDDESLVRLGIKSSVAWEEYGYEIVGEADNGQTGLEMIREKHPDIVLLDVCMPVMNGIEVLKSLQKLKIQCKVIILSYHDDFCFVKEAMKNGAFDYLRKNEINSANILTVLEEVRHSLCKKQDEGQGGWDSYARHVCLHRLITGSCLSVNCTSGKETSAALCLQCRITRKYRPVTERDAPSHWNKALSTSQWKCCTSGRRNWKFFFCRKTGMLSC